MTITAERLRELMAYNPQTGLFMWLGHRGGGARSGDIAGRARPDGYINIRIEGRLYFAHRLAWLAIHGSMPERQIDHINGNRADNRIENLRDVSVSVNQQNLRSAPASNLSSGLLGVSWHKGNRLWLAQITVEGKNHCLGYFDDPQAAHAAYLSHKRSLHPGCTL